MTESGQPADHLSCTCTKPCGARMQTTILIGDCQRFVNNAGTLECEPVSIANAETVEEQVAPPVLLSSSDGAVTAADAVHTEEL